MGKEFILSLMVIIPLGTAFVISLFGKYLRNFCDKAIMVSSFLLLALSLYCRFLLTNTAGTLVYKVGGWNPPFGICMVLDGLSCFMLVTVNIVAFLIALYSLKYMEQYTDKPKFFTLFSLMVCGMNGVILTGDIFNLFVFVEIASIASYALVAFGTEAEELEASFKYAIMGSIASIFIFIGIALLYGFTSTLNMADMAKILTVKDSFRLVPFVAVLFLMGFGIKAALVPFHAWLADAHPSAPASISAMLSGLLIKTLGVYSLVRIFFNVFNAGQVHTVYLKVFMFLGALSIIVGVILAISQWDLKRLLAYHSVSQVGYIILGIGLGTPLGILGGLYHLFNHSIFKSLLFLNSGAVDYSAGTRDLKETGGLAKVMPVTYGTSLFASMSIAGVPPFNGFFSKFLIILACAQAGHIGYGICAVIGSILTLSSFMKVQKFVFLGELKEKFKKVKEVPFSMQISMIILAVVCLLGGLMFVSPLKFFLQDAVNVVTGGMSYSNAVLGGGK